MSYADALDTDITNFLERHEVKQLLRLVTVGSVDDGKSTLIGRLLHDTQGVYEDQLEDARRNAPEGALIDFSLITDGLVAEREQGITIDVAYRYFTTAKRKFIIADTPGHVQYTRNMATGASTANVALILIDARLGVLQQSRRHAYIASLLGIPHLLVCVNKMDLVNYSRERFEEIAAEFRQFSKGLRFSEVTYLPVSALQGDNVVEASTTMPWHKGTTVIDYLESVDISRDVNLSDFRYPVQTVIRPHQDYRGVAGQVLSGVVRQGDAVTVLPAGTTSTIAAIDSYEGALDEAFAPMSVTLRLADAIDISRGDMIVHSDTVPHLARTFNAVVVWMSSRPLDREKSYFIKHTTRYVRAGLHVVKWKLNMDTLAEEPTETLELNQIGQVTVTAHRPLVFDSYERNRGAGCFVIVDSLTNNTVGAGMIFDPDGMSEGNGAQYCSGLSSGVSPAERRERLRQMGAGIWVTGSPGETKTHLVFGLERRLFDLGYLVHVLDPDDDHVALHGQPTSALVNAVRACSEGGLLTICIASARSTMDVEAVRDAFGKERLVHIHVGPDTRTEADMTVFPQGHEDASEIQDIVQWLTATGILSED